MEGPHLTVSTTNQTLEQEAAERLKIKAAIWGSTLENNRKLEGDELIMKICATHFAQEWAIKAYDTGKELSSDSLPDEYK